MSSSFYTEAQGLAYETLVEYGTTVAIALNAGGTIKPKCIFISKKSEAENTNEVSPLTIMERECIIDGRSKKKPDVGDTLTHEKIVYRIADVEEIRPTNITIIYKLRLQF
jgi:hypothetical protein